MTSLARSPRGAAQTVHQRRADPRTRVLHKTRWHGRWLGLLWCTLTAGAWAQAASAGGIYSCTDARGRRLTSDRPIPECLDREQQMRSQDGAVRKVLPPSYSPEERARLEEQRRQRDLAEAAQKDRVRHDRNLLARFPDAAAHDRARLAALDPVETALVNHEKRLAQLERERKTLADEAEFYPNRDLPRALKLRIENNRTALDAQKVSSGHLLAERQRLNTRYDEELAHLRRLWAGAAPGSLGATASAAPSAAGSR